jgi:hypothetical protein
MGRFFPVAKVIAGLSDIGPAPLRMRASPAHSALGPTTRYCSGMQEEDCARMPSGASTLPELDTADIVQLPRYQPEMSQT